MKRNDLLTAIVRFWSKVDRSGECWLWSGDLNSQGYGRFELHTSEKRERVLAHRLAYMLFHGENIDGLIVRHDCDTPRCCNPAHLRSGTQTDNMRDALKRKRMNLRGLDIGREQQAERVHRRLETQEKRCPTCGIVKPFDAFHRHRSSPDGRQGRCKECQTKVLPARREDPEFRERELARGRSRRVAKVKPPKPPRTHCGNGHELTPENLSPRNQCKQCARDRSRRATERKRQEAAMGAMGEEERKDERRRRMRKAAARAAAEAS